MKNAIFSSILGVSLLVFGQSARAQIEVFSPPISAQLTEIQSSTLVPMLDGVLTTSTNTGELLTMLRTPYPVAEGFAAFDGSAVKDATAQAAELSAALSGSTHTSTSSTALETEDAATLKADEAKGDLKGNGYQAVLTRNKNIGENLAAMGVDDFRTNAARLDAATAIGEKVSASATLMEADVMGAAVGAQNLKQAVLNGKLLAGILLSENADHIRKAEEEQREIDGRTTLMKQIALSALVAGGAAASAAVEIDQSIP